MPNKFDPRTSEVRRVEWIKDDHIRIDSGMVASESEDFVYLVSGTKQDKGRWLSRKDIIIPKSAIISPPLFREEE